VHGHADRIGQTVSRLATVGNACARIANPNEVIEGKATFGQRIADRVAGFARLLDPSSISFLTSSVIYTAVNIICAIRVGSPILHSSQFVSFGASGDSSASDHDEPEPPGHEDRLRTNWILT